MNNLIEKIYNNLHNNFHNKYLIYPERSSSTAPYYNIHPRPPVVINQYVSSGLPYLCQKSTTGEKEKKEDEEKDKEKKNKDVKKEYNYLLAGLGAGLLSIFGSYILGTDEYVTYHFTNIENDINYLKDLNDLLSLEVGNNYINEFIIQFHTWKSLYQSRTKKNFFAKLLSLGLGVVGCFGVLTNRTGILTAAGVGVCLSYSYLLFRKLTVNRTDEQIEYFKMMNKLIILLGTIQQTPEPSAPF